jgi:outer membrane protein OmpA-like peptidoglycan-associated protein
MKRLLTLPILALLVACPAPKPEPAPRPEPKISALVLAVPSHAQIVFEGEKLGPVPAKLKVHTIDQLADGFTAANMPEGAVEQRISVISESEVEVTLVFDSEHSKMAKALGLSKILVFDYGEGVTFDSNQSEVKPDFMPLLTKQAEMLKKYFSGIDIHICGHTDSRGGHAHNQLLSVHRAQAVKTELVKLGVPQNDMKVTGHASDFPLVSNDTEEGRARNRRIEIILGR